MSDDMRADTTITLCADPNDGTHGLFIDGKLVLDSGDEDVTVNDPFWPEAVAAVCEALGITLVEESRYRPSRKDYNGEYDSYWPETLDGMGPVEEPYVPDPDAEIVPETMGEHAFFEEF
jgi:hypothetical protein